MNWRSSQSRSRSRRRCLFCDSHVTRDFARTFGDEQNVAHRCLNCDIFERVTRGSAAGVDVDKPDPQTTRGRHVDVYVPLTDGGDQR